MSLEDKNKRFNSLEEAVLLVEKYEKELADKEEKLRIAEHKNKINDSIIKKFKKIFDRYELEEVKNLTEGFASIHRCGLLPYLALSQINVGAVSLFILLILSSDKFGNVDLNRSDLSILLNKNRNTISDYIDILEENEFIKKIDTKRYKVNFFYASQGRMYKDLSEGHIPRNIFFKHPPRIFRGKNGLEIDTENYYNNVYKKLGLTKPKK